MTLECGLDWVRTASKAHKKSKARRGEEAERPHRIVYRRLEG